VNTAREHGRHFGQAVSRVGHGVSQNLTLAVIMGVQNDTRVHGPCSRPVNTGSVYRALVSVTLQLTDRAVDCHVTANR